MSIGLLDIPDDVIIDIIEHLHDPKDLARLQCVNTSLKILTQKAKVTFDTSLVPMHWLFQWKHLTEIFYVLDVSLDNLLKQRTLKKRNAR